MNELPVITIITPSYNQVDYLETTILSVLGQEYPKLEYIIMDGGSDDGSVEVIKRYENDIHFWSTGQDKGQSDAIRKGFNKGVGDILGWINSDDAFFPGALSYIGDYFSAHPHVDILLTGVAYSDMNGAITKCYYYPTPSKSLAKMGAIAFGQQGMFFRREIYEGIGGLREDFHYLMDLEFLYNAIYSGANVDSKRLLTGVFRWHGDMKSINRIGRKAKEIEILSKNYCIDKRMSWFAKKYFSLQQIINFNYLFNLFHTIKQRNSNIDSIWAIESKNN